VSLSPGAIIDEKYRIVRQLGAGGMGAVYEAENLRIGQRVAIKVMHAGSDSQDVLRFEREARAASQIGSRYIVEVFDLGNLPDGSPYMVMEYLEGETLGARLVEQLATTMSSEWSTDSKT
jgi:serine/threonine-protein kinase